MESQELIYQIIEIAKEAGAFILKQRVLFSSDSIEYKGTNDLVSYVDKEAERIIVEKLKVLIPDAGFIAEEGTLSTKDRDGLNWIIDPLDGTTNFVHGLQHYSVSLALAKGKDILAGVVYDIPKNDIYWAYKGFGAYKNDSRIQVSDNRSLSKSLLATGFPYYEFEKMENYLDILKSLMQKTHGLRRCGSAALDLAYTSSGIYDGFFEFNLKSWDIAAGALIVREAGGKVTDFDGGEYYLFSGNIIASNDIHEELLNEILRFW